jgi:hypothetical protein
MSDETEARIAQQLAQRPEWRLPPQHLVLAQWLNQLLDEGRSEVITDPAAFGVALEAAQREARGLWPGDALGLAGYPDFDLSGVQTPRLSGACLVFYVQEHRTQLPYKVSVSLVPPHLPAVYERLPGRAQGAQGAERPVGLLEIRA